MNKKPFFSVVMPTRNRAKLLPFAVQSVLNQTFDDYEVIVSDNFSSDETPQIARDFNDKRLKYFRSEKPLSMGESWEYALSHAVGEYICFLSDDDAYSRIFLERMSKVISDESADIVTCKITPFYAVDDYKYGRKITGKSLIVKPYDRKISALNRKEAVKFLFDKFRVTSEVNKRFEIDIPQLVNTAYRSSVIDRVKSRVPKIFPILSSDIYSSVLFLNSVDKYCYLNEPLYLHTVWEESATSGEQSFFDKYPEERELNFVPLKKLLSTPNYITNIVLRAKSDWGADFQEVPIDWKNYFISSFGEIMYLQRNKVDVSKELEEFEEVLSGQDKELQMKIRGEMTKRISPSSYIKGKLKNTGIGGLLLKAKNRDVRVLNGFDDITKCAESIDEGFLNKYSTK